MKLKAETFWRIYNEAKAGGDLNPFFEEFNVPMIIERGTSAEAQTFSIDVARIDFVATTDLKEILKHKGIGQSKLAKRYNIPIRTVQNWCMGIAKCPDYLKVLICKDLGMLPDFD